jgi:aspartyl-tRNA synthetase
MEVCPIADLNPGERRWVIKCRVTRKIPINNHPKDRGKGQIIYVDLKDASGEIRGVAFHQLVDKVNRLLEVDKEYFISGRMGCLMNAKKKYNPLDHEYEIRFKDNTCIKEVHT